MIWFESKLKRKSCFMFVCYNWVSQVWICTNDSHSLHFGSGIIFYSLWKQWGAELMPCIMYIRPPWPHLRAAVDVLTSSECIYNSIYNLLKAMFIYIKWERKVWPKVKGLMMDIFCSLNVLIRWGLLKLCFSRLRCFCSIFLFSRKVCNLASR